jgi:hypothetical protein
MLAPVRIALVGMLAGLTLLAPPVLVAPGLAASDTPTLRVASGPSLVLVGTGFMPRSLVRVRVTGPGVDRSLSVRAGAKGAFTTRFAGLDPCAVKQATASGAGGTRARVPTPWFVRECPPPPPLAPGVYAAD